MSEACQHDTFNIAQRWEIPLNTELSTRMVAEKGKGDTHIPQRETDRTINIHKYKYT